MRMLVGIVAMVLVSGVTWAEDKTCAVEGMHCKGCTEMVSGKVCGEEGTYSKCEVKVTDAKKKLGFVRLATKDAKAKIDEKALGTTIADAGYKMKECKVSK